MKSVEKLSHLLQLLQVEKAEDLRQYQEMFLNRSRKERVDKGVTWFPVTLRRTQIGLGERLVLELERGTPTTKTDVFQSGSMVSVFGLLSDQEAGRVSGVISAIRPDRMKVVLASDFIPDWLTDTRLGVDLDFDDKTYQEMNRAVRQVIEPGGNERLKELREVLLGDVEPDFFVWDYTYHNPWLNEVQNQAVQRILEARDVAIIHGPPGTGKTTTLVQAIKEVLQREHQVLVCAPSNTAVDLLTLRCAEQGLSVLRMGNPARVDDTLLSHTLDGSITRHADYQALRQLRKEAEALRRQALKYKRRFGSEESRRRQELLKEAREASSMAHKLEDYIIYQTISQAQVITATLAGAAHSLLEQRRFHTVFIDEAGQALAPACWIPLLRAHRVIMAGDHYQLPPTVKSPEAEKKGLGKTLFEQVIESKPVSVMLEQQYRMHHQIMGFSGAQFYNHRLQADPSVHDHVLAPGFDPLEYVDTAGCGYQEERNPETQSLCNPEEAGMLLRHLAILLNQIEAQAPQILETPVSIGIISPYKDQVRVLKTLVAASPMLSGYSHLITINTVDGFQGQERDIIYISLVRSNRKNGIGFLADTRRMNVAMTRARKKLVIVGDSATLGEHPFYESLLAYVDKQGAYHTAWEWISDPE
ncbi:MAG: AAA domain-containing protein [Bacteroidia bacterium]|nr:AAA domain-containing protein [Bacteroidia bacterium]